MSNANSPLIAVLGAAGISGLILTKTLKAANLRVRAVAHGDEGAAKAKAAGADEVVQAEFSDPASLDKALEGVSAAHMIPPSMHPQEDLFATNVFHAAERAGVQRFVYASVMHPHTPGLRHHMRKAQGEAALRDTSLTYTILQPAMYAQVAYLSFGARPTDRADVPFNIDLPFSMIDLRDLSAVALMALTQSGHEYATYELAGPALTVREAVEICGKVRNVKLTPARIAPADAPMPPRFAAQPSQAADLRAMWENYDHHGLRGNPTVLRTLLGREPASFEDVARSMQA